MAGYSWEAIRDLAARFGSIAEAEEKALTVPGFGEEIRRVDRDIDWLTASYLHPPPAMREKLEAERRSLVVEALKPPAPDAEGGALLPVELVERAVQLHVSERLGKRKPMSCAPVAWLLGRVRNSSRSTVRAPCASR